LHKVRFSPKLEPIDTTCISFFDSIFLLLVWPKLHVDHPFLLIKHASHFCTLFQPSTRSANVRYYYFRFSRYRALTQRLRSRRVLQSVGIILTIPTGEMSLFRPACITLIQVCIVIRTPRYTVLIALLYVHAICIS